MKQLMPHPKLRAGARPSTLSARLTTAGSLLAVSLAFVASFFALPTAISVDVHWASLQPVQPAFPITVYPDEQKIVEDPRVEQMLTLHTNSLQAAAITAGGLITRLAEYISELPLHKSLASVGASGVVTVRAGYRQEEVASVFAKQLGWNTAQKTLFLKQLRTVEPILTEGQIVPGTYAVRSLMTPADVQIMLNDRYQKEIVSRYSLATEELLPLHDALTIASLLQKETRDPDEMRVISGIIWNRLWIDMRLQIDATLQYAKANKSTTKTWWPVPVPADKYIKSAYNTYQNKGLPPGPIASPSMAAVLAALNPKNTDCMFYFHDARGTFHCTETYEEHVRLLKKYYGQGK
jgi:cell division protein YceG involved in septum cleavage